MSAAALHDVHRIWNVSTLQRDPRTIKFLNGFALLLTAAIPIVGGVSLVREHTLPLALLLRILVGIAGFWMTVVWVWLFVPAAVLMNSASNARLMPRQRRRLLQMAFGGWLLVTLALTTAFGKWPVFPLVGMYVLGFALMRAGNLQAVALTVVPGFYPLLSKQVLPATLVQTLSGDAGLLATSGLLMAGAAWSMSRLYPAAGDRHLAMRGEQLKRMSRSGHAGLAAPRDSHGFMTAPGLRLYAAILRRDCRVPRPARMAMHALGPMAHWSAWTSTIAMLVLLHLAGFAFVLVRGEAATRDFITGFSWGGLSGLGFMISFGTAQVRQQVERTRGEQALLLLTPLAGDKPLLNRRLAARMLHGALLQWAALTLTVVALGTLFGGADLMLRQFAVCCLGGQVALASLFGDFARTPKLGVSKGVLLGVLTLAEVALAAGLGWLSGSLALWTWPWLVAISVAAAALQVRHGWKVMLAAPVAFPAGRLG